MENLHTTLENLVWSNMAKWEIQHKDGMALKPSTDQERFWMDRGAYEFSKTLAEECGLLVTDLSHYYHDPENPNEGKG